MGRFLFYNNNNTKKGFCDLAIAITNNKFNCTLNYLQQLAFLSHFLKQIPTNMLT